MVVAASNKENMENLNNIGTRDSHHFNTSVIFVCQNLNYGNRKLRNVRINSQYHLMLKNLSDLRNIEMIAANKKISTAKITQIHDAATSNIMNASFHTLFTIDHFFFPTMS